MASIRHRKPEYRITRRYQPQPFLPYFREEEIYVIGKTAKTKALMGLPPDVIVEKVGYVYI